MTDFFDMPLYRPFIEILAALGIRTASPIQEQVIPRALAGKSVLFESETGTGKTLAFLLPLLTRLVQEEPQTSAPRMLILSPTVELASQIKDTVVQLQTAEGSRFKSLLCVGGSSLKRQIEGLKEKPAVIIGTPARIADLVSLKQRCAAISIDGASGNGASACLLCNAQQKKCGAAERAFGPVSRCT